VCNDSSGNIWFGTINGLTRYNPKTRVHNDKPPLVSIAQVSLFYESLQKTSYADAVGAWNNVTRDLVFPHDQNHISFDLSAINLSNPDNVKISWMLTGFDHEWSPPSDNHNATYANLPPGDYTFMAKAYNEDGISNNEPVKLHFVILKPWWAEWWFIASATAFVLLSLVSVFRLRVSSVKRKAADQRRRLQLEKSMVELEQKALRLQMNPHFIFNALNSIQSLISSHDEQTARFYLAKFSKLMRMILENSRNMVVTLDDEIKTLDNYLALEKFCSGDKFDYRIEADKDIDTSWITLPPMMIQPFAENAVIHGLKHLDRRGEIAIRFSMKGETLECSITDNGIGREKAAALNLAQRESHHKSTALKVTQERLDLLNKENTDSSLEIIDLKDGNGNATGTRVVIRIRVGE
jgi:two-component sensor histidine kinase